MANFKRGRFSAEEKDNISKLVNSGMSVDLVSRALNRSVESINKILAGPKEEKADNSSQTYRLEPIKEMPDANLELPKGYARRFFEIDDSKNPGKKRTGISILTESGSEAGDDFNKANANGLLPMSSKHKNCTIKAQG